MHYNKNLTKPLTFPLTKDQIENEEFINIESPTFYDDKRVTTKPEDLKTPTYENEGNKYWLELAEVATKVNAARKKTDKFQESWLPTSLKGTKDYISETFRKKLGVKNFYDGALAVKSDWPDYILSQLVITLFQKGAKIKCLFEGQENHIRFTNGVVLLSNIITDAIYTVSPNAFAAKWHFGAQRPSEAAGRWARGEANVSNTANAVLETLINKDQVAQNEDNFSIYNHPGHCTFPAMHGASAGSAVLLPCLLEGLTPEMIQEIRLTVWNTGSFRDFAGVHFRNDTVEGIKLGEKIINDNLYDILVKYSEKTGMKLKINEDEIKQTTKNLNNIWD